ncbi:hypothetical protein ACFL5Z_00125 [Planctomycetota bacterium]
MKLLSGYRNWRELAGIATVLLLSATNAWGAYFQDDFNRPDGEVGNGWAIETYGTIEIKIVDNEVLIAGQQPSDWWWKSGIRRSVEDETRFSFDFKADDNFTVHIIISDPETTDGGIDFYASPGGPFSYSYDISDLWSGWIEIPGSRMIAGQYNTLLVEQEGREFTLTLNGQDIGTVMNNLPFHTKEVFIGSDATLGSTGSLHIDNVQIGTVMVEKAKSPSPEDGALHEDTWITLFWNPGDYAVSHDVYLGEDFDDVNDATRDSDVYRGNQMEDYYIAGFPGCAYPEGLVLGTTYYWRIDEVNDVDPNSPWKGDIWSFTIPPKTAFTPDPADGAEIMDTTVTLRWTPGFGARLHTVFFGDNYDEVSNATEGVPRGTPTYDPGPLEREKVYYWRVDEFDGLGTYKGNIWTFTTLGAAGNP